MPPLTVCADAPWSLWRGACVRRERLRDGRCGSGKVSYYCKRVFSFGCADARFVKGARSYAMCASFFWTDSHCWDATIRFREPICVPLQALVP
jgi:hypothetical protein